MKEVCGNNRTPMSKVENSAQVLSCLLKFVYVLSGNTKANRR